MFLPRMLTDVTLEYSRRRLIVGAKCYGTILNAHFEKEILSSVNVNQIFSHVLHSQKEFEGNVSGILLYAQTLGLRGCVSTVLICGTTSTVMRSIPMRTSISYRGNWKRQRSCSMRNIKVA